MLLFFLFLAVIAIIVLICTVLFFSDVKVIINDLELIRNEPMNAFNYQGKIGIYFLGKVKIFSKKVNSKKKNKFLKLNKFNKKLKSIYSSEQAENRNKLIINKIKEFIRIINIEELKLSLLIDTESVMLTSYLIGLASIIFPNIIKSNIKKYDSEKFKWTFEPLFKNQNCIYLKLNSIISIRLVHIINMLKVRGGEKNERTSNRRINVNCYGEH